MTTPLHPEDLVARMGQVQSLPESVMRLNQVVSSPACTTRDLAAVLEYDQGLAARVLKIANSPLYGFPARIGSITHAIAIIGTRQLRDLAVAGAVVDMFAELPPGTVDMRGFWEHGVAVGLLARQLALRRREPDAERHFLAGLLHDIGSAVLFSGAPDLAGDILARGRKGQLLHEAEYETLGFDHATLGACLLRKWNLPSGLADTVAAHHANDPGVTDAIGTALVQVAESIATGLAMGSSGEALACPLAPASWKFAGIPETALSDLVADLDRQVEEVAGSLGLGAAHG